MKKKSLIIIGIISILFTGSVLDVRAGTVCSETGLTPSSFNFFNHPE